MNEAPRETPLNRMVRTAHGWGWVVETEAPTKQGDVIVRFHASDGELAAGNGMDVVHIVVSYAEYGDLFLGAGLTRRNRRGLRLESEVDVEMALHASSPGLRLVDEIEGSRS